MDAKIILTYDNEMEAGSISKAVSPDNVKSPAGLSIRTQRKGASVVTVIRYDGDRIETFLSTIDDLLECIQVAEKTILTTKMIG